MWTSVFLFDHLDTSMISKPGRIAGQWRIYSLKSICSSWFIKTENVLKIILSFNIIKLNWHPCETGLSIFRIAFKPVHQSLSHCRMYENASNKLKRREDPYLLLDHSITHHLVMRANSLNFIFLFCAVKG